MHLPILNLNNRFKSSNPSFRRGGLRQLRVDIVSEGLVRKRGEGAVEGRGGSPSCGRGYARGEGS